MRVVFDVVNVKTVLSRFLWYCHVPFLQFCNMGWEYCN